MSNNKLDNSIDYSDLENKLTNDSYSLSQRFRILFYLKSLNTLQSLLVMSKGFNSRSNLFKHEVAYCLGQTKDKSALPILYKVVSDLKEHPMVRHEAAEAIGAIGEKSSLDVLTTLYTKEKNIDVKQTLELAIERIKSTTNTQNALSNSKTDSNFDTNGEIHYSCIDPALPLNTTDLDLLERIYLDDENQTLYQRYQAMFSLRNIGTTQAVLTLAKGLKDKSALFRHEVAFVFGQMQHKASIPALIETLEEKNEESMVRHECAEALGAIADERCFSVLKKFVQDQDQIVRESCIVALDMYEYENDNTQLEYAVIT